MSAIPEFTGFPQAGLQFLRDLSANNNKDWFDTHKNTYIETVRTPAQALVAALGERLQGISPDIRFDTRTNGSGSLMRINRDVRFSADKSPYKTNIAMMFWQGPGKKMDMPGFGLQISPFGETGTMGGMFGFSKTMLQAYREAVAHDDLGPALVEAVDAVRSAGEYRISGEHYKRVPRGFDADHPRAEWLKYAGLHATSPQIPDDVLTSPAMVDVCFDHFKNMAPIQQWLVRVMERTD